MEKTVWCPIVEVYKPENQAVPKTMEQSHVSEQMNKSDHPRKSPAKEQSSFWYVQFLNYIY